MTKNKEQAASILSRRRRYLRMQEFMESAEYTNLPQVCRDHPLVITAGRGGVRPVVSFRAVRFFQVLDYDVNLNRMWRECEVARVPMVYLAEYYMNVGYSVCGFWEIFEKYIDEEKREFKEFGQ